MDNRDFFIQQLRSSDEETRRRAVVGLAACPMMEVKESLLAAMGDESWRVRKEAVAALLAGSMDEEMMQTLVSMLRSNDNAGLRNSAVEALEKLGSLAVPSLSLRIDDNDHDVRKFVIDILGSIGDAAVVPLLVKALGDPDPNVSAAAAENLGKIADPAAVPHLVRSLAKDDIWFRYTVLEALSKIGRPVPIDVIAPLAGENLLKKAVFDCLGAIGGAEATSFLVEGLKERVKNAREAAATALIRVRERLATDVAHRMVDTRLRELAGSPFVEWLLASMDTSDRGLKEALVRIMGLIGDERAVGRLLNGCRDESLRNHCLLAFGNMGKAGADSLLSAFSAADDEERCFIVYVCGELRYEGCGSVLSEAMHGDSPLLRKLAAGTAGKIGLTSLVDELVLLLEDGEPKVRQAAVEALARLAERDRETVLSIAADLAGAKSAEKRRFAAMLFAALRDAEKLSLLIKDEDAVVRKAAVDALAELKASPGISSLVMALADEDVDVRIAAAGALGEIGGDDVLQPLLLALKDEDSWVKCAALKGLGKLSREEALPAIVDMLHVSEGLELISALETVAQIGGERVGEIVRTGLENADEEVVKAAIEILAHNGNDWIDEYGDKLRSHAHWDVRRSFVVALSAQRGVSALPLLESMLQAESDKLVKETLIESIGRLR